MQCIVIHKLSVFDIQHLGKIGAKRKKQTLLSLDIDGTKVYSVTLPGVVSPYSGQNTVGLFRNDDKRSVCAWIDPVSEDCYIASDVHPWEYLVLTIPLAMLALAISTWLGWSKEATFMWISFAVGTVITVAALVYVKMRKIESALRAVLTLNSTHTPSGDGQ